MKKNSWLACTGAALMLLLTGPVSAQCVGDCTDDGEVAVNELVLGVNIALGATGLDACPVFDANGDQEVAVNELVTGVNNALNGCPSIGGECGNSVVEGDEQCDDGNTFGGDTCASNCTNEVEVACSLGSATGATVQTTLFAIPLPITGSETLTFGKARGASGTIPVIIKVSDLTLDAIPVPGLVCACVRGAEGEGFGPGNAAKGQAGCGPNGLDQVDYTATIDHNIGDVDPSCETGTVEEATDPHPGVCNGTQQHSFVGGGARGSMYLDFVNGISLIADGGLCETNCSIADTGPDCIPCTDDDLNQAEGNPLPLTTGTATGKVIQANNVANKNIEAGVRCGGSDCLVSLTGTKINCDLMSTDPVAALAGSSVVGALASVDAATIGDNVTTSRFSCE